MRLSWGKYRPDSYETSFLTTDLSPVVTSPCASIERSPGSTSTEVRRVHDASATALAAIPDELPAEEAGPFMCAGVTVCNALRNSGARAGEVVAVYGIGGLGHLGVQYARRIGFRTVAINRANDKEPLARRLGAQHYIDASTADVVAELQKLGRRLRPRRIRTLSKMLE